MPQERPDSNVNIGGVNEQTTGVATPYEMLFAQVTGADLATMPSSDRIRVGDLMRTFVSTSILELESTLTTVRGARRTHNTSVAQEAIQRSQDFLTNTNADTIGLPQEIKPTSLETNQRATLTDLQSLVLSLQGMSHRQIAATTGRSAVTVGTVLERAMGRLRKGIGGESSLFWIEDPHPKEMPRLNPALIKELRTLLVKYGSVGDHPREFVQRTAALFIREFIKTYSGQDITLNSEVNLSEVELPQGLREWAATRGYTKLGELLGIYPYDDGNTNGLRIDGFNIVRDSLDNDPRMQALLA